MAIAKKCRIKVDEGKYESYCLVAVGIEPFF